MDEFVRSKLNAWGLSEWIENFRAINEEMFKRLREQQILELIPDVPKREVFRKKLEELKQQGEATNLTEVQSSMSDAGKRKLPLQGDSSRQPTQTKRHRWAESRDTKIQSEVKEIMRSVSDQLDRQENTDLNQFLKKSIKDLETDKRELVGVFGKTGAGKSSLINAVIGEEDLLPFGSVRACTSVMIKVESKMHNKNYKAEIEFIAKEDWKAEVWSMLNFLENYQSEENSQDKEENNDCNNEAGTDEEDDDGDDDNKSNNDNSNEYCDIVEKLTALYREEWKQKSSEELMGNKYFREIPDFLENSPGKVLLTRETAKELSEELVKYTRNDTKGGSSYWPLVKCVTVTIPENRLLQHVTLVDLPGNGDCNKSRDTMWKQIVGNCSTVWIVSEINRAASEQQPWEILESTNSLLGNGGECRQIHFICSKSDASVTARDQRYKSADYIRNLVLSNNKDAKESVRREFEKRKNLKHFNFEVFTVSSDWFQEKLYLSPEETEIPKLQDILRNLNDEHSEAINYVSGAHGILSLIQGASLKNMADRNKDVCEGLDRKMKHQLDLINAAMKAAEEAFDKQLSDGVQKSKRKWKDKLKFVIDPPKKRRSGFHKVLKCLVENGGIHKPKKKKEININMKLSYFLTECIDEEFRKTFPNETKCGPFNGAINKFSLGTENLKKKYKDMELQLIFLQTEEEKLKAKLSKTIRDHKKRIYLSLTKKIEEAMEECYDEAKQFYGKGVLNNMTETIKNHVQKQQNTMFEEAKQAMLASLRNLTVRIPRLLEETLNKSIELSLKTNHDSIPDFAAQLEKVQQLYNELKNTLNEERS